MSGVPSVFVKADGSLERRVLESDMPVYRVPMLARMSPLMWRHEDSTPVDIETDDYTRRGRLFDGTPVLCANGLDVKECRMFITAPVTMTNKIALMLDAKQCVRLEYPGAIELDRWEGDATEPHEEEELRSQGLMRHGVRLLVAVKVSQRKVVLELRSEG